MEKKSYNLDLIIGIILTLISTLSIFDKIHVFSYGFAYGKPNVIAIVTLFAMLYLILYVFYANKYFYILLAYLVLH